MYDFHCTLQRKSEKCYFCKMESIGSIAFSEATCRHSHWRVTLQCQPDKWHFFKKRLIVRFGVHCVSRISKLSNGAAQNRRVNTLHSSRWRLVTIWSWVLFRRDPFILVTIDQNNDQPWSLFTFGYYLHQFLKTSTKGPFRWTFFQRERVGASCDFENLDIHVTRSQSCPVKSRTRTDAGGGAWRGHKFWKIEVSADIFAWSITGWPVCQQHCITYP